MRCAPCVAYRQAWWRACHGGPGTRCRGALALGMPCRMTQQRAVVGRPRQTAQLRTTRAMHHSKAQLPRRPTDSAPTAMRGMGKRYLAAGTLVLCCSIAPLASVLMWHLRPGCCGLLRFAGQTNYLVQGSTVPVCIVSRLLSRRWHGAGRRSCCSCRGGFGSALWTRCSRASCPPPGTRTTGGQSCACHPLPKRADAQLHVYVHVLPACGCGENMAVRLTE